MQAQIHPMVNGCTLYRRENSSISLALTFTSSEKSRLSRYSFRDILVEILYSLHLSSRASSLSLSPKVTRLAHSLLLRMFKLNLFSKIENNSTKLSESIDRSRYTCDSTVISSNGTLPRLLTTERTTSNTSSKVKSILIVFFASRSYYG